MGMTVGNRKGIMAEMNVYGATLDIARRPLGAHHLLPIRKTTPAPMRKLSRSEPNGCV